ncbi:hypothetical protein ACOS9K_27485, partial [Klebsiella pneumoniae]
RSPVRKSRTPGSVRGVSGNGYPYRDILGIVFIEINLKYPLLSNDSIPTKYGIIERPFFEN